MSGVSKKEEKVKEILKEQMNDEGLSKGSWVTSEFQAKLDRARVAGIPYNAAEDAAPKGVSAADASPGQQANAAALAAQVEARAADKTNLNTGVRARLFRDK